MPFEYIIIIPILIGNYYCWRNIAKNKLNKALSICIWLVYIFWYSLPGMCYLIIKNNDLINLSLFYSNLENNEFVYSFLIENISIITVFILLSFSKPIRIQREVLTYVNNKNINLFLSIYFILITLIAVSLFSKSSISYLEINSGENYGNSSVFIKLINELEIVFKSLIICFILNSKKNESVTKYYFFLFLGSILPFYVGNRASILLILLVFVIKLFSSELDKFEKRKRNKNLVWISIFVFFIVLPLFSMLETTRQLDEGFDKDILLEKTNNEQKIELFAVMIFTKFDFYSTGVILTRDDGYSQAGITPYIGSAFSFIPRNIINRPIAGSFDGTIYGHPSRIPIQNIGIKSESANAGVAPVHISIWQFGYLGILLFIASSTFYILWLNKLLNSNKIYFNMIALYTLGMPLLYQLFPSPDVMLKLFVQSNIYMILIYFGIKILYGKK